DGEEPGRKGPARVVAGDRRVGAQEGLLHHVLGVVVGGAGGDQPAVQALRMALDQRSEGGGIACRRLRRNRPLALGGHQSPFFPCWTRRSASSKGTVSRRATLTPSRLSWPVRTVSIS